MDGLRRLALTRCSGLARTALRVTSLPVPAVVGMAMQGAAGGGGGGRGPMNSGEFKRLPRVGGEGGEGLGSVENAAAAEGDDEIVIAGRGADERERGLARDGEGDG